MTLQPYEKPSPEMQTRRESDEMTYDVAPAEPEHPEPRLPKLPGDPPGPPPLEIEGDLHCVQCGYNLRGLTRKHRCPECGTRAQLSIAGDLLKFSPAGWLKKVKNGLVMMLWSVAVDLTGMINTFIMPHLGYFFALLGAGLAVLGVFYLTTPEPRTVLVERTYNLRKWIRQAAVLRLACALLVISAAWGMPAKVGSAAWLIGGACSIAILFGVSFYLRRFARRMEDYDLERETNRVIWGLAISLAVFVICFGLSMLPASVASALPAACVAIVALSSAVLFACWFLLLLSRYYSAIKWAAHLSELNRDQPGARLD